MNRPIRLAALLAALLPAAAPAQDAAKKQATRPDAKAQAAFAQSTNNLKQIGIALHNFAEVTDRLPAQAIVDKAGKPLLSWRVAILPYLEGGDVLHKQFKLDEAWDGPNNKKLLARMPTVYASPGGKSLPNGQTRYLAFAGPDSGFPERQGTNFLSMTDGTSNTAAVAEVSEGVPWTKPEDVQGAGAELELDNHGGLGRLVLLFDGSVQTFMPDAPEPEFRKLLTRAGGEAVAMDKLVKPIPRPPGGLRLPSLFGNSSRAQSMNNLKQIGIAMHTAYSEANRFPAQAICSTDGKPLLSWRVAILPYIEQDALYKQFKLNEPWDSPHNLKLAQQMPKTYALPGKEGKPDETYYQVFVGKDGGFEAKAGKAMQQVLDGTSFTILAIEAPEPVTWTKPNDIEYERGKAPKLVGHFGGKLHILMMDGSVRAIAAEQDAILLDALITPAGGEAIKPDAIK